MARLAFTTLYSLVIGLLPHFLLINQRHITSRYFYIHGIGSLLLLVPAIALFPRHAKTVALFSLFSIIAHLICAKKETLSRVLMALAFFIGLFVFEFPIEWVLLCAQASLMLGTSLGAMCVGHWYLNQPKLNISEFRKQVMLLICILIARDLFATYFISQSISYHGMNWLLESTPGLFLLMRATWGLIAPTVLSYFVWQTVKISSTQSATGLLYVNLVMVLIGEIMSLYLFQFHGVLS